MAPLDGGHRRHIGPCCATTSGDVGCPIGRSIGSTSTPGSRISKWLSTAPASTASRSSACPKVPPSPLSSPCATPNECRRMVLYGSYARGRRKRATRVSARARRRSTSSWRVSGGAATTRRSARCSRRSSFPTEAARTGTSSTSCNAGRSRRRMPCASWRRSPTSTSPAWRRWCVARRSIVHARDDHRVPSSAARELAALIPGSRFVLLPGRNHLLRRDEPAWPQFLAELDRFLADET